MFFLHARKVLQHLRAETGCRIGEAAVCSRKVHTVDPYRPEVIAVVANADAGKVFYRRQQVGDIIHVDIFHEIKHLSPQPIAAAVQRGLQRYLQEVAVQAGYEHMQERHRLAHYFDVQTALGGGRVTGRQLYGQRESVKKAHLNHVHITGKLSNVDLAAVFYVIAAVEQAIIRQGAQLRCIEYIMHEKATWGQQSALSNYASFTDSFLREPTTNAAEDTYAYGHELTAISDILENLADLGELSRILNKISQPVDRSMQPHRLPYSRYTNWADAVDKLRGYGLVQRRGNDYQLTAAGEELRRRLLVNARELEAELRKQSLLMALQGERSYGSLGSISRRRAKRGLARPTIVLDQGESLAATETVISALVRQAADASNGHRITQQDLRWQQRQQQQGIDICLLIDASASMLGKRMKAAKSLAGYLVQNSRDRISVITFQEQAVEVVVPFTRNHLQIKQCLDTIQPGGLTPLAAGLRQAAEHVCQCRRSGLLLLITDGIPTLGQNQADPLRDALEAALDFKEKTNFRLCCIGLQPNHRILQRVVETAGGSLYAIDELNSASLLQIADRERSWAHARD